MNTEDGRWTLPCGCGDAQRLGCDHTVPDIYQKKIESVIDEGEVDDDGEVEFEQIPPPPKYEDLEEIAASRMNTFITPTVEFEMENCRAPHRATLFAKGYDLFLKEEVVLAPSETKVIDTGVKMKLTGIVGGYAEIRDR